MRRTLGENFSKHVLAKTLTVQRITLPQCLTWHAEDVDLAGESQNSTPIIFYDSNRAVLYAANGEFFSNACRKLMTRTIKKPQHGIRAQLVLKLTNKLQMTDALTPRRERVSS